MMFLGRLWHLVNRRRREQELLDEMREHREAMHDPSKFGDTHRLLERSRDAWGWNWLDDAMQDLAVGVRTLIKTPSFAITATLILTFGIGLNVTLYQMLQVGLLRPPAVKDADSWVRFLRSAPGSTTSTVPYPLAQFVKDHNSVLAGVTVETGATSVGWGRDAAEQINASFVSANWFDELGYGPLHGRVFSDALDSRADVPAVVLSYTFWNTRLGADPNVVGTTAYVDRHPVIVAGVGPAALPGLDYNVPDIFVPIEQREYFYPQSTLLRDWDGDGNGVDMYGRLRPGVSPVAAREALRATMQAIAAERPQVKSDEWLEPLLARHNFMRPTERYGVLAVVSLIASLTDAGGQRGGSWIHPRCSSGPRVARRAVLPRERRSDCVRDGARRTRQCRRACGIVAGIPGIAAQSGRRATAFLGASCLVPRASCLVPPRASCQRHVRAGCRRRSFRRRSWR